MSRVSSLAREVYRQSPLYRPVQAWMERRRVRGELERWARDGMPVGPVPHAVKQGLILRAAQRTGARVLVETGTYMGTMVEAMRGHFELVASVEVQPALYERAKGRFRGVSNVRLFQGDSATQLTEVCREVGERPTVFWLDGHYSGGETGFGESHCPVLGELDAILGRASGDAILIDDARYFGVDPAYPTVDEVVARVASRKPALRFERERDVLCFWPRDERGA